MREYMGLENVYKTYLNTLNSNGNHVDTFQNCENLCFSTVIIHVFRVFRTVLKMYLCSGDCCTLPC